jgi:AAA domain, putative AbiEii toxin, Type IV TA system/AAA domain
LVSSPDAVVRNELFLPDLQIRGFRGFDQLDVTHFGRVNLVVGQNNAGKSSLLEAIRLYAGEGALSVLVNLLLSRDEVTGGLNRTDERARTVPLGFASIAYGRKAITPDSRPVSIGPLSGKDQLTLAFERYVETIDEETNRRIRQPYFWNEFDVVGESEALPVALIIRFAGERRRLVPIDENRAWQMSVSDTRRMRNQVVDTYATTPVGYIGPSGVSTTGMGELWDGITLTPYEDNVLSSLRIIAPNVAGLAFVGIAESASDGTSSSDRRPLGVTSGRIPVVRLEGDEYPIPLRSMGDGMTRLLGITLALASAANGILLVDEIENGVHYSVQPDLWRLIFGVAKQLNVQVFATTHSWDTVVAFQSVAAESAGVPEASEGLLIRLQRLRGETRPTLFDAEKLAIATREQIEVR